MPVESKQFGTLDDGEVVTLYTFTNKNAVQVQVITLGAVSKGGEWARVWGQGARTRARAAG